MNEEIVPSASDPDHLPIKSWPDLFELYRDEIQLETGREYRAELSQGLALRAIAIEQNLSDEDQNLLLALAIVGKENAPNDRRSLENLAQTLHSSLGPQMASLIQNSTSEPDKQKIRKDLIRRFKTVLDAAAKPRGRPPHKSKHTVNLEHPSTGQSVSWPLSRLAIDYARELVEENPDRSKLPSKKEVRSRIEQRHPEQNDLPDSLWTKIFKEAGLDSLPRADTW